jgi:phosphocarrier protein
MSDFAATEMPAGDPIVRTFTVSNRLGLHMRPATTLANTANAYRCDIWLFKDEHRVPAKSLIGILTLSVESGAEVIVQTHGEDAAEAMAAMAALFESGLEVEE